MCKQAQDHGRERNQERDREGCFQSRYCVSDGEDGPACEDPEGHIGRGSKIDLVGEAMLISVEVHIAQARDGCPVIGDGSQHHDG